MIIKNTSKQILQILILISLTLISSCRKEEIISIQTPEEDVLESNSNLANLMQRTAINDGSKDNILDNSNCFTIQLPITVYANGIEIIVSSESNLEDVEDVFDEFDNDTNNLDIIFPITVMLSDYSVTPINNLTQFNAISSTCSNEHEIDYDIECLDFQYPITASSFNANNELLETTNITNDNALYNFIEDIDVNDIIVLNFPITIILFDNTQLVINNLTELENTIETYNNSCDEDDDFDFDDDDCNNCTIEMLNNALVNCPNWIVDRLKRESIDLNDQYDGYAFNFFSDNTISVAWASMLVFGTYSLSGTANNITVIIDIPSLPLCNNNWSLREIDQNSSNIKIDLKLGDPDRLRYQNSCN